MKSPKLSLLSVLICLILVSGSFGSTANRENPSNLKIDFIVPSEPLPTEITTKLDSMVLTLAESERLHEINDRLDAASMSENSKTRLYNNQLRILENEKGALQAVKTIFNIFGNAVLGGVGGYISAKLVGLAPGPAGILVGVLILLQDSSVKGVNYVIDLRLDEISKVSTDLSNHLYNEYLQIDYEMNQGGGSMGALKPTRCKYENFCRTTEVCAKEHGEVSCRSNHVCFVRDIDCG